MLIDSGAEVLFILLATGQVHYEFSFLFPQQKHLAFQSHLAFKWLYFHVSYSQDGYHC